MKTRLNWPIEKKHAHIRAYKASGLKQKEYEAEHGLPRKTLSRWLTLKLPKAEAPGSFQKFVPAGSVEVGELNGHVRLEYKGITMTVSGKNEETLRLAVKVLTEHVR